MAAIGDPGETTETAAKPATPAAKSSVAFDDEIYLRLNPDVRLAVAAGTFRSGREHYERYGHGEGRPLKPPATIARDRIVMTGNPEKLRGKLQPPACAMDAIKISPSGAIYIVGWVNDSIDRLDSVDLYFSAWSVAFDGQSLARLRRPDTEAALNDNVLFPYGFWGFLFAARRLPAGVCSVVVRLKSGAEMSYLLHPETADDHEMRKLVLSHLAACEYFGNPYFEAVAGIEHAIGAQLVDFNKMLTKRAVNAPYVERFGPSGRRYKASFVVCLYGKTEYMFLQHALFARQAGMQDYEFIYVLNSPWIAEQLLKEAKLCAMIYGLDMSVIILNGNGGFGAANNVAAAYANSDRLIIMNPDVFPRDPGCVARHTELVEALPAGQTALFGAPLYYDDGSLMHAGMYFDRDRMPSFSSGRKVETELLRVEHYGKGAPPDTAAFLQARPVPGVTGAFISLNRAWFEKLEGFTIDYVFGHYEDADLCLKSLAAGQVPWLQDIRFWHLEGKGSERKPQHEGGSVVNRWLFSKTWGETVKHGLLGPHPAHPAFRPQADAASAKPARRPKA